MLFNLVRKICTRIDRIDVKAEAPKFAEQLRKMRPSLGAELRGQGVPKEKFNETVHALSYGHLMMIKTLPNLVAEMSKMLQDGSGDPSFRCVLAVSLAYLVQPRDLLPDDLPGGYGFVDDALLLNEACALSWDMSGDTARASERRKIFQFIFTAVPDDRRELFQTAVGGLAVTLNTMRALDPMIAEMTAKAIIANPLQAIPAPGSAVAGAGYSGFDMPPGSPTYTWKSGETIGVNFPGGGGVVAGPGGVFET